MLMTVNNCVLNFNIPMSWNICRFIKKIFVLNEIGLFKFQVNTQAGV